MMKLSIKIAIISPPRDAKRACLKFLYYYKIIKTDYITFSFLHLLLAEEA